MMEMSRKKELKVEEEKVKTERAHREKEGVIEQKMILNRKVRDEEEEDTFSFLSNSKLVVTLNCFS